MNQEEPECFEKCIRCKYNVMNFKLSCDKTRDCVCQGCLVRDAVICRMSKEIGLKFKIMWIISVFIISFIPVVSEFEFWYGTVLSFVSIYFISHIAGWHWSQWNDP